MLGGPSAGLILVAARKTVAGLLADPPRDYPRGCRFASGIDGQALCGGGPTLIGVPRDEHRVERDEIESACHVNRVDAPESVSHPKPRCDVDNPVVRLDSVGPPPEERSIANASLDTAPAETSIPHRRLECARELGLTDPCRRDGQFTLPHVPRELGIVLVEKKLDECGRVKVGDHA